MSSPVKPARQAAPVSARLAWLLLFGAAFGYLEAAVVVYLRDIFHPDGFAFPLAMAGELTASQLLVLRVEIGRELSTLVILLGIAGLAARSAWGRFGAFAVVFGVWDLVYYVGLKLLLDWPASLGTWDVLFLIPGVWTGPVWSAAAVAALLIACGAWILKVDGDGRRPRPGWIGWSGGGASLLLLLAAFMWNHETAAAGGVPSRFPWEIWLGGVAIGLGTFAQVFLRRPLLQDPEGGA